MRRQLDTVLDTGVSGVVACGKTGEFEGQTLDEVEAVISMVLEHVGGRVPVGMGIISVELEQGLRTADRTERKSTPSRQRSATMLTFEPPCIVPRLMVGRPSSGCGV